MPPRTAKSLRTPVRIFCAPLARVTPTCYTMFVRASRAVQVLVPTQLRAAVAAVAASWQCSGGATWRRLTLAGLALLAAGHRVSLHGPDGPMTLTLDSQARAAALALLASQSPSPPPPSPPPSPTLPQALQ